MSDPWGPPEDDEFGPRKRREPRRGAAANPAEPGAPGPAAEVPSTSTQPTSPPRATLPNTPAPLTPAASGAAPAAAAASAGTLDAAATPPSPARAARGDDATAAAPARPKLRLDDLVIRASSHTPFFGVYLATHAIPDALCMCHASVGCKVKTQHHLVEHDGVADAHNRMRYSQFIDEDLISGSTHQLEEEIVAFQARRQSQVVVIDSSTPISLQAQPMAHVCARLEQKTGVHVVAVDARNYDADLWEGYDATIATLLDRQTWPPLAETAADEVAILGLPFDRYEPDQQGTVAELRRLAHNLGLQAKAIWLAGEPYATLQQVVRARHMVLLPWAQGRTERALRAAGRHPIRAGLPLGLEGTDRWLRGVAAAIDATADKPSGNGAAPPPRFGERAERLIKHERGRCKELYALAHRRLSGRGFALFGDAPRVAGVAALLMEVGMVPVCLGTCHFSLGGRAAVEAMLRAHHGRTLPDGVHWLQDPTPHELRALADDRAALFDVHGQLQPPPPGAPLPPLCRAEVAIGTTLDRDQLAAARLPFVEFGYPSERAHFLFPAPWLGSNGALRLLERVLVALEGVR